MKDAIMRARRACEEERDRAIEAASQRVLQEKVNPYFQEIDDALSRALEEKRKKLEDEIQKLQTRFSDEKQQLIEASEKRKREYKDATIASATAELQASYNRTIQKLNDIMDSTGE